jgi:hypothetical protein
MRGVMGAAAKATELTRAVLTRIDAQSRIHDVQDDPRFQHRGVDLLWERNGTLVGVEVKGDRQAKRRQRYFFELVSNFEKNSPGCFLYSTAQLMSYVLLDGNEVHLLSLPQVRAWFLTVAQQYPLKATQTMVGPLRYTTVGAPVPIRDVKIAVPQAVEVLRLNDVRA